MTKKVLNKQDLLDICDGAAILGTGGGGSPELGKSQVLRDIEAGRSFHLIDLDEVGDDLAVFCPAGVGTIAPRDPSSEDTMRQLEREEDPMSTAFKLLEDYIGAKAGVVIPFELGGRNTARALSAAARFGIPCVDGDPVGRAVPELEMTSFSLHGLKLAPACLSNFHRDRLILKDAVSSARVEAVARSLAVSSFGWAAFVACPCKGSELRNIAFIGTISKCLSLGKAAREAVTSGKDPIDAIVRVSNGFELFRGIVANVSWKDEGGFMKGDFAISGQGEHTGRTLKVWFKNENHIAYLNGRPFVMSPDLICVVDEASGRAITNTATEQGMRVTVIGMKSEPSWRTQEGVALMGPRHFGFNIQYRPIEEALQQTC